MTVVFSSSFLFTLLLCCEIATQNSHAFQPATVVGNLRSRCQFQLKRSRMQFTVRDNDSASSALTTDVPMNNAEDDDTTATTVTVSSVPSAEAKALVDRIRALRVKDIQRELLELNVATTGIFEKEDLVQLLISARQGQSSSLSSNSTASSTATSFNQAKPSAATTAAVITTPLYFTFLTEREFTRVPATFGLTVEQTQQPYSTIQIQVIPQQRPRTMSVNDGKPFTLSLLLDTACSGMVLRPEIVTKYGLPSFQTPVTMTGAAGTSQRTGLTRIDQFIVPPPQVDREDDNSLNRQQQQTQQQRFGPLPVAVQDIGALPSSLDGIIGLTFLNQFEYTEMDFTKGVVSFYKETPPYRNDNVLATADLKSIASLGIFAVDVYLGGRGPVSMLFDTGASSSLLNWKGVSDLGLSRSSQQLSKIQNFGAIGSDNVAMQLTHRLHVSSNIQLGELSSSSSSSPSHDGGAGIDLNGKRIALDIGNIPVIDDLSRDGVGGILGIDVLMQCKSVRLATRRNPKITLYD